MSRSGPSLADTIPLHETRACALAALVDVPDPARARRLAARAVFLGGWAMVVQELEEIAPGAAPAIADEVAAGREARALTTEDA